jgi:hypothetical protein
MPEADQVFHNVLHAAPSHEAWTQALVRLVATSWRFLPKDLWKSIGSVTEPLDRLSFAFARIAPRFMVITVFRSDVRHNHRGSPPLDGT